MGLFLVVWLQVKIQNSVTNNGFLHIDILIVIVFPLVLALVHNIRKILVNALSDRYTHWSSVHHGGNTICTTSVVDRDDTAYMVVDREFRLPTE